MSEKSVNWKDSLRYPNTPIKGTSLPEIRQKVHEAANFFKRRKSENFKVESKDLNSEQVLSQNIDSLLMRRLAILATPVVGNITVEETLKHLYPIESSDFFNLKKVLQDEVDPKDIPTNLQDNFKTLTHNDRLEFDDGHMYHQYTSRSVAATWFLKSLLTHDHGRDIMSAFAANFSEDEEGGQNTNLQNPYWQFLALPTKDGKMVIDKLVAGLSQELSQVTNSPYHGIIYSTYLSPHPYTETSEETRAKIEEAKGLLKNNL